MAQDYLSKRRLGHGPGLGRANWHQLSVPGNHDQWPGMNVICGGPTAGLAQTFQSPFPIIAPPQPLANGRAVQFISVDSDADVRAVGIARGLARGSFVSQLTTLDHSLPPRNPNEIRVLVVHHSMVPLSARRGNLAILDIDSPTLQVLECFIVDHDISVVMCDIDTHRDVGSSGVKWKAKQIRIGGALRHHYPMRPISLQDKKANSRKSTPATQYSHGT